MRKVNLGIKELGEKALRVMKNRRGNGTVSAIVISAIILIALVLLNTPIRTFISSVWTLFANFVEGKLTTLFSS